MDDQRPFVAAVAAAEVNANRQTQVPPERITLRYLRELSESQRNSDESQPSSAVLDRPAAARKDPPPAAAATAALPDVARKSKGNGSNDVIFIDSSSEDEIDSESQRKSATSKRRAKPPQVAKARVPNSSGSYQKASTATVNHKNVRGAGKDAARITGTLSKGKVQPTPPGVANTTGSGSSHKASKAKFDPKAVPGTGKGDNPIYLCDSDCDNGGDYETGVEPRDYDSSDDDDDEVEIVIPCDARKVYGNRNGANVPNQHIKRRGAASLSAATTLLKPNRQYDSVKAGKYARVGKASKALNSDNNNNVDDIRMRAQNSRQRELQGKDRARPFKGVPQQNHYNRTQGQQQQQQQQQHNVRQHSIRQQLPSVKQNKKRKKKDLLGQQPSFSSGTQNKERKKKDHLKEPPLSSDEQSKQQLVGQQPAPTCDAQNKKSTGDDAFFRERFDASKKMKLADTSPWEPYDGSIMLSKLGLKALSIDTDEGNLDRKPCARESSVGTPSTTTLTKSDDLSDSFESFSAAESEREFTFKDPHDPREARLLPGSSSLLDHEVVIDIKKREGKKGENREAVQLSISDLQDASLETNRLAWLYRETSLFSKSTSTTPYTKNEFKVLWGMAEGSFKMTTTAIEKSGEIRKGQGNGVYGRVNVEGMRRIFKKYLKLNSDSCFLDIGHGIGNTCLQAAYTFGCEARGIEVDSDRSNWGNKFHRQLKDLASIHRQRDGVEFKPGKVELRVGSLKDDINRSFQVEGVNAVFVNNFGGVFSSDRGGVNLDSHIAGLFAMMKPGTIMATLHDLRSNIGHSQKTVTEKRKSRGLPKATSINASFFEYEEANLGYLRELVSWSEGSGTEKKLKVHIYRRTRQEGDLAVKFCNQVGCDYAERAFAFDAIEFTDKEERFPVIAACPWCGRSDKASRKRELVDRYVPPS